MKLPARKYEFNPHSAIGRADALARTIADITAASHLDIPFTVTTVETERLHRGNVNEATFLNYEIEFGKVEKR